MAASWARPWWRHRAEAARVCAATMDGRILLPRIHIDPSAVMSLSGSQPDVEMLEDSLVAAVDKEPALQHDEAVKWSVQGLLGGLKLPELGS